VVLEVLEVEGHYAILMKVGDKSNPYMGHVAAVAVAVAVAQDTLPAVVIGMEERLAEAPKSSSLSSSQYYR
jgi:hypothetical protein